MSYRQIKWLILIIPTLTIGLWEYVRHEFLLPYISMDLGNWLAPVLVFGVSMLLLTKLFAMIEQHQEELNQARAMQAALEERERIAHELHDGIAQTLFFLNAQVMQLERKAQVDEIPLQKLKDSVRHTNDYVRQAIAGLRQAASIDQAPWMQGLTALIEELRRETNLTVQIDWRIPEQELSAKEKVELLAIIREALMNVHKHAQAQHVIIEAYAAADGWTCMVSDDGRGFQTDEGMRDNQYGLRMMQDRARLMDWRLAIDSGPGQTSVMIAKGAADYGKIPSADRR